MIITRPANRSDGACVDCGNPSVLHVRFQYSPQSSQSFTVCRVCQGILARKLLPPAPKPSLPRKALQAVFDMACELSKANEYSEFVATPDDFHERIRTGPRADIETLLLKVKEYFKLKGRVE